MAKLLVPILARAYVNNPLPSRKPKASKYHFMNMNSNAPYSLTVCGMIWPDDSRHFLEENVRNLNGNQLCMKCLGAMQVEETEPIDPNYPTAEEEALFTAECLGVGTDHEAYSGADREEDLQ